MANQQGNIASGDIISVIAPYIKPLARFTIE
jgi:hypothetical protein